MTPSPDFLRFLRYPCVSAVLGSVHLGDHGDVGDHERFLNNAAFAAAVKAAMLEMVSDWELASTIPWMTLEESAKQLELVSRWE